MEVGKTYSIPDERIYPKLVDWTKLLYDKFTTNETDALVVAQLLGHSSLGGAFYGKIALMSSYGLVERRSGKVRVTETGKKIVFPSSPKEKYEGVKAAVFKVTLWERLYQEYTARGAELPGNFWANLATIADIPPDEAKSKADLVAKAFNSDISYLKAAEKDMGTLGSDQSGQIQTPIPQSGQGMGQQMQTGSGRELSPPPLEGEYESGRIYFISPDDKVKHEAPRSAWQIDLLKTYIDGVLDHVKEQLVNEARYVAEKDKAKKPQEK